MHGNFVVVIFLLAAHCYISRYYTRALNALTFLFLSLEYYYFFKQNAQLQHSQSRIDSYNLQEQSRHISLFTFSAQVTNIIGFSAELKQMSTNLIDAGIRLGSVNKLSIAGSKTPKVFLDKFKTIFNLKNIKNFCGITETGIVLCSTGEDLLDTSVGFPVPHVRVKVNNFHMILENLHRCDCSYVVYRPAKRFTHFWQCLEAFALFLFVTFA